MNYNPFEKPFASGELIDNGGGSLHDFKFILDNPLKEGVYLFEIVENDLPDHIDDYVYTGIFKVYNTNSPSSEFYGQAVNFQISFFGTLTSDNENLKSLSVQSLNNDQIDLSSFSYTIKLYKIV